MSAEDNQWGNQMAATLQTWIKELGATPPILDYGEIQKDMSLVCNLFPHPIPPSGYDIFRSISYNPAVPLTETETDGTHPHGPSGEHAQYSGSGVHSHPGTEGAHAHQVKLPKKMWRIQPGDRVAVAWILGEPLIMDVVVKGTDML
jgi:hypothetical protein